MSSRLRPAVLCILDGWGHRPDPRYNAILDARTPSYDRLIATCPQGLIDASETFVGLPQGQMGNSEVGHMNLGAGRVAVPDLPRINNAIADGSLAKSPILAVLIDTLKRTGGACHLLGLASPGGVHSHQDHLVALANLIAGAGVRVWIHAFLDGRDMPPRSALECLKDIRAGLKAGLPIGFATVAGRYYPMDRDKRWERVALGYGAMVDAKGEQARIAEEAVEKAYAAGLDDEFVLPTVIDGYTGMKDGDGLLMFNFRADRARQILTALLDPRFDGFNRARVVKFADAVGMVEYSAALSPFLKMLFPSETIRMGMGETAAKAGLKQLRIAETEKYAHVTFFFNGGEERQFEGEDRILVPSPKVKTYDLQPEMSAPEVTDKLVEAIGSGKYDLIVVNYANSDMVGHTGNLDAAIQAIEAVDSCLGRLMTAVKKAGGVLLITADHGNAEQMFDETTHQKHTQHTLNRVPALLFNAPAEVRSLADGKLADVAPTMLALMGVPQPAEMTGRSLLSAAARSAVLAAPHASAAASGPYRGPPRLDTAKEPPVSSANRIPEGITMTRLRIASVAAIMAFLAVPVGITAWSQDKPDPKAGGDKSELYQQLNLFGDVLERVRREYVEPVEEKTLIENAINGMLTALDPHSSYMNPKTYKDMQIQTKGEFGGLGIEVTMENGVIKVVSPIDDTPASRAGLQPGDLIFALDGQPVQGLTLQEAVEKMRGKVGTPIKISVRRGSKDPFDVSLTRETIKVKSVRYRLEGGDIGYIRVTSFTEQSTSGVLDAIEKLKKEAGNKLKGYILDLRNNPGGLLDQAIAMSDAFLDKGEIVSVKARKSEDVQRWNAKSGDVANGLPIVVLVNGGSASASEIVAGALQDHRRAIILGTRSFGKGSVQTIMQVTGGGAIRLTTALYFTPSGRSIQKEGIKPDIEVEPAKIENLQARTGFREENLRRSITNPNEKPTDAKPTDKPADVKPEAGKPGDKKDDKPAASQGAPGQSGDPDEPPKEAVADYQLLRAADLIRGISLYSSRAN